MSTAVEIGHHGAVTCVTLNRPDVRNAVDAETARQLHAAFVAFEADSQARVAVFHGANGHFCAGWDLQFGARMLQSGASPLAALELARKMCSRRGRWVRRAFFCPSL